MGSSFLTAINVLLALYSLVVFIKIVIQFGLPNHPARFTLYLVSLCATAFFTLRAATDLGFLSPLQYMHWRPLPVVGGGLGLLLQVITSVGDFSRIQQKVISRVPLIGGLVVFSLFPLYADQFFGACLLAIVLFLSVSVGKARYQKRALAKMIFFVSLSFLLKLTNIYWNFVLGEAIVIAALFYFFIFEQSCGVRALVEKHMAED